MKILCFLFAIHLVSDFVNTLDQPSGGNQFAPGGFGARKQLSRFSSKRPESIEQSDSFLKGMHISGNEPNEEDTGFALQNKLLNMGQLGINRKELNNEDILRIDGNLGTSSEEFQPIVPGVDRDEFNMNGLTAFDTEFTEKNNIPLDTLAQANKIIEEQSKIQTSANRGGFFQALDMAKKGVELMDIRNPNGILRTVKDTALNSNKYGGSLNVGPLANVDSLVFGSSPSAKENAHVPNEVPTDGGFAKMFLGSVAPIMGSASIVPGFQGKPVVRHVNQGTSQDKKAISDEKTKEKPKEAGGLSGIIGSFLVSGGNAASSEANNRGGLFGNLLPFGKSGSSGGVAGVVSGTLGVEDKAPKGYALEGVGRAPPDGKVEKMAGRELFRFGGMASDSLRKHGQHEVADILDEIMCPKEVTAISAIAVSFESAAAMTAMIPEAGKYANGALQSIAGEFRKCKAKRQKEIREKNAREIEGMLNKTSKAFDRMVSVIERGFERLDSYLEKIHQHIARGHEILDRVDRLVAENKFRKFSLKIEILMEKMEKAFEGFPADIVDFISMCNNVENNDKYLILELDEIFSIDASSYVGLNLYHTNYIDETFLEGFRIITMLIMDLKKYRSLCYFFSAPISDPNSDEMDKGMTEQVKQQIKDIYDKVVSVNKQREESYFNQEILFPKSEDSDPLQDAYTGPRGYSSYLTNNYALFDTRNYTVYKCYRYSVEFGTGNNTKRDWLGGVLGIPDPDFIMAYDRQLVTLLSINITSYTNFSRMLHDRRQMTVVRTRINDPDADVPTVYVNQVRDAINDLKFYQKNHLNTKQLLEKFWCGMDYFQLISVYIATNIKSDQFEYPHYGFGNCFSQFKVHFGQIIWCYYRSPLQCNEHKKSKMDVYVRQHVF